jgi:glycosyltransferase involved in cell wall biosynthesis
MRIVFIEPHLQCVGGIRRIVETANGLIERENYVDIYTPKGIPCAWLQCKATIYKLSLLGKREYDVAIFNLAEQYVYMKHVRAKLKVFWVLAAEAIYKNPVAPLAALKYNFCLMANSKFTVEYIRKHIVYPKEIPIFPGGINPQHFHYDPTTPKKYTVLYYGSARPWKGASFVESAMRKFPVGKVPYLRMEGLNTPQEKMYTLYNSAHIYASANLVEGFSFGQLEAMACGCAVVTTDDGGSRDYIKSGYNAIVTMRDPNSIYEAVLYLMGNDKVRKKMIAAGLQTAAESRFKWGNQTSALENFLKSQLKI